MTKKNQKKASPKSKDQRLDRATHDLLKGYIYDRDDATCQSPLNPPICTGKEFLEYKDSTVDHIVPLSKGGTHHPDNLRLLCKTCHVLRRGEEHWWGRVLYNQDGKLPENFYDYIWD